MAGDRSVPKWLVTVGSLIAIVIVGNLTLTIQQARQLVNYTDAISHTHEVKSAIWDLSSEVAESESAVKGFLLTGHEDLLAPYSNSRLVQKLASIEYLAADNPKQRKLCQEMRSLIAAKMGVIESLLAPYRSGTASIENAMVREFQATELSEIREMIERMLFEEQRLLVDRKFDREQTYAFTVSSAIITALIAVISLAGFFFVIRRHDAHRVQVARESAERARRWQITLESIGDGVIVTDALGRLESLNREAERLTGWSDSDAIGHPLDVVFRIVDETTRQTAVNPAMKALHEGTAVGVTNHTLLLSKGGGEVPIDESAAPIRSENGEIIGSVLVFRDVRERRANERTLLAKSNQLQLIKEMAGIGSISIDYDADTALLDAQAASVFGLPTETPIPRRDVHDAIHPDDRGAILNEVTRAMSLGDDKVLTFQHRIVAPHGVIRWVNVRKLVTNEIRDGIVRPVRGMVSVLDISEATLAKMALERREGQQSAAVNLLETLGQTDDEQEIGRVVCETVGKHLETDRATLLEISATGTLAKIVWAWPSVEVQTAIDVSLNEEVDSWLEPLRNGVAIVIGAEDRSDSSVTPLVQHKYAQALLALPVMRGKSLQSILVVSSCTPRFWRFDEVNFARKVAYLTWDVIERARGRIAVKESEKRFRALADNMSQLAWMAEGNGEFSWFNQRWQTYTGINVTEMSLAQWMDLLRETERSVAENSFKNALNTGEPWEATVPIRGADGEYRWFLSHAHPIRDDAGRISRWFGSHTDVTDQKMYESSLKEARLAAESANRSRGEFLANMSHEIRTPMTAIMGHLDILADHVVDPDNMQTIDTIRRNGRYLLQILNDILDLSKIDAGKFEVDRVRIRPDLILADIRSLMDIRAREKELNLDFVFRDRIPEFIETDVVRLRQILLNLVGNAIKFTPQGSVSVQVGYDPRLRKMQFEVVDTGVGIAPHDVEKLFKPFSQVDTSAARVYGGTGLGLAISRRLVQLLGGDISVESEVERGSRFTFTIDCGSVGDVPLITPCLTLKSLPDAPDDRNSAEKISATVLIVDDRRDIRFVAQHFVEKAGGQVLTATNGEEAVRILMSKTPSTLPIDVVLMDMQMPIMDGYKAVTELRQRGFTKPIIALTANAMKADRDRCLSVGCNEYLSKPLDGPRLIHIISRLTDNAP